MAKIILGITGEMACGKGTIAEYVVKKYDGSAHRFSTMLRDVLDRLHIEQTRENIVNISTVLRKTFGEDLMAKVMKHDAENDEHEIVVVEGVRRMDDIKYLKELPHFKLIYIDATIEKRYERVIKRGENIGESQKTFDDFKKAHEYETEIQIPGLKQYSNYVVNNDSEFEDLYKQVDDIIKENLK